jgi:hypothetical protein
VEGSELDRLEMSELDRLEEGEGGGEYAGGV